MKKIKRCLCLLLPFAFIFMTGCWSSHEVSNLAICSALGIDKTENGYLITEQIINPVAVASQKAINESPVVVYSVEGESIDGAINYLLLKASRLIYNTHLRMVVFGEAVAKDGIKSILDFFMRSYEYRTDFSFVVARNSTAKDIISILTPLESIPAIEMYNMLKLSSKEVGTTNDVKLVELINSIASEGMSPALTGIEIVKERSGADNTDVFKQSGNYDKLHFGGLCAFNGDKFAGWLTEEDSKGYMYINNKVKASLEVVQCGDDSEVICNILSAKSKVKAEVKDGRPSVSISISAKYAISATRGSIDITKNESSQIINKALEDKIKKICETSLERAQKELQTDIFGFGGAVHRKNSSYWKSVKDGWSRVYADMPVNISVKAKLISIGELTQSLFAKEKG